MKWRWFCILMLMVALIGLWACPIGANAESIVAHFDDGNTTDEVDGYLGKAGLGWAGPWEEKTANIDTTTPPAKVLTPLDIPEFSEIKPGWGNYLEMEPVPTTGTTNGRFGACRDYKGNVNYLDYTKTHVIDFTGRINEDVDGEDSTFTEPTERYSIFDATVARYSAHSSVSWNIAAEADRSADGIPPRHWVFYDGDNDTHDTKIDTGISVVQDGVYDFTVTVHPETQKWDATITHGAQSYTEYNMGWRTRATDIGGVICFATFNMKADDLRDWSMDGLTIIPEPSMGVLMLIGTLAACLFRRRKR